MGRVLSRAPDQFYLAILTAVTVLLRIPLLSRGFWRDEGLTYADIAGPTFGSVLHNIPRTEVTPPLYFLLLHGWAQIGGSGEAWLRLPSLACIIATILILYTLCARLGQRIAGLIGATIAAFAPLTMQAALEARAYGLTLVLSSLTLLCFVEATQSSRSRQPLWAVAFAIACVGIEYTHYTGIVVTGTLAAVCVVGLLARRRDFALPMAAATGALVLVLPAALAAHGHAVWHNTVDVRELGIGTALFLQFFGARIFEPYSIAQFLILAVAVSVWIFAASRRGFGTVDSNAAVFLAVFAAGVASDVFLGVYGSRHVTAYAPALWLFCAILGAEFLQWLARPSGALTLAARVATGTFAALFVVSCLARAPQTYALYRAPLSGAKPLAQFVDTHVRGPILLVAIPDYVASGIAYYVRDDSRIELRGVPQWVDPWFFLLYSDTWNAPGFVAATTERIRDAGRGKTIVIAYDPNPNTWNANDYPRTADLVAQLTASCVEQRRVFHAFETLAVAVLCP